MLNDMLHYFNPKKLASSFFPVTTLIISSLSFIMLEIELMKGDNIRQTGNSSSQQISNIAFSNGLSRIGLSGFSSSKLWLDFVQYIGEENSKDEGFRYSTNYLQSISNIEPRFISPYLIAVSALGFRTGRPEVAKELLERGILHIPPELNEHSFRIPFHLATVNFLFLGDNVGGRDAYYLAAERYEQNYGESANQWRELGDNLQNNPRSSLVQFNVWHQVYKSSLDAEVKRIAYNRLLELGSLETTPDGEIKIIPPTL